MSAQLGASLQTFKQASPRGRGSFATPQRRTLELVALFPTPSNWKFLKSSPAVSKWHPQYHPAHHQHNRRACWDRFGPLHDNALEPESEDAERCVFDTVISLTGM